MMTKVYIHGANATPISWNYIRNQVGDGILLSYNSMNGFKNNLREMKAELADLNEMQFIGHSLGGIFALHLANHFKDRAKGAVTISTPYGGHSTPYIVKYIFQMNQLFNDISPKNWPIDSLNEIILPCNWCNIVTTVGDVPWILGKNDGIVTIKSQRYRNDMELLELKYNHYEVMLSQQAVDIIKLRLN
jgi:pimeloyl-ACP methyl ester carboxylesterase